ncbi:activin receptor type-2A-like isoform X1 [Acanthaster planci]|uniref:Serine/threonine-protein kinase receptor n=1 Tax=Acanthaster planci TaxID=133434 RepID=A0A8B7ZX06_ACAPL|nr:activin receptor type-2A-like isoform X1 [Acanthaster planci]XP_022109944.1 activin receptor type-2A-like isoform X1 [Acanthaster planci]
MAPLITRSCDFVFKVCLLLWLSYSAVLLRSVTGASVNFPLSRVSCFEYDSQKCSGNDSRCSTVQDCDIEFGYADLDLELMETNKCFILWQNTSAGLEVIMKGCWQSSFSNDCVEEDRCVSHETYADGENRYFCCCSGDLCNHQFYHDPQPKPTSSEHPFQNPGHTPEKKRNRSNIILTTVLYTLVPITAFTIIIISVYWICRRYRYSLLTSVPNSEPSPLSPPSPVLGHRPIQLLEIKARGRFGAVWRAQMGHQQVAVKIFPLQDRQSWVTEQEIYSVPQLRHENLLSFIGTERRGEGMDQELWLITEYHPRGSLCDYLKGNLLSWSDLCKISLSMAYGLAYLHEDLPATTLCSAKPAVAHRDFKSKNVLLKNDLSACIADFGLACKFEAGKSPGDTHGQVGTRRYMAPEVLEGAIQFQRDAFLRIDMYACGLVLWEIASRCTAQEGPVDEYMLPFEEEVGQAPTLEDMQDVVVVKRLRPVIRESWLKHSGMRLLFETIEECWDHDSEARLSAGCVEERLSQLLRYNVCTAPLISLTPSPPKESSL